MCLLGRLVFLDSAFGIGGVRYLETLLSAKLDPCATDTLPASRTRISADRRRRAGLGAASIGEGDYGYEAIGAHHEKTHAVEETVIFYVGHGPLAMLDAEGRIRGATGSDGVNAFAMAHA